MKKAIELVADERQRQIDVYGYSDEHILKSVEDYGNGELAAAAVTYAGFEWQRTDAYRFWPWAIKFFKGNDGINSTDEKIKNLTKAGAMIVAEIDRLKNGMSTIENGN